MNPSPHIERLAADGYYVEIREEKFLIIKRVPYLNRDLEVRFGSIISPLEMNGNDVKLNPQHPVYFSGEQPYKANGVILKPNNSNKVELLPGLHADFYYSYKKNGKPYQDYYEKMSHYVHMFSKHAMHVDATVTFNVGSLVEVPNNSPFKYSDCNSASPEVNILLEKFSDQKIGIIGLGGTGSYILDFVAKTPVAEIHLFDADYYQNKNAFRAPGSTPLEALVDPRFKTDYFKDEYSKIHKGITSHPDYIRGSNLAELDGLTFIFISIDKSPVKEIIIDHLQEKGISFIDVGMGVNLVNDAILGQLRTTTSTGSKRDHIRNNNRIKFSENQENDYSKVIQIAELNSLNAAFAVIKWKKLLGFYHDRSNEFHSIYQLPFNKIQNFDYQTGT
jgi:hypothetical protein